jgi:hypothetical protein
MKSKLLLLSFLMLLTVATNYAQGSSRGFPFKVLPEMGIIMLEQLQHYNLNLAFIIPQQVQ